jgi:hypothetical protein
VTTTQPVSADGATQPALGRHAAEPTVGQLVADASTHVQTIIQGEIALAKLELKSSVKNAGVGAGFFGAAAVLLALAMPFALVALAEGITAAGIWRWASYLIVFGAQLLLVGLFVLLGVKKVKRVKAPQRTIDTGRDTVAYLKAHSGRS